MKKIVWILIVVSILAVIVFYRQYSSALLYSKNPSGTARIVVDVPKGSTADDVAETLLNQSLIKSATIFKMYLNRNALASELKAGRIIVKENMKLPELVDALIDGRSEEMSVTLLEGWTIKQIAGYLASTGLTTTDSFLECIQSCEFDYTFLPKNSLEGYLYPDTYFVNLATYSDQRFIGRLIKNFSFQLNEEDFSAIEASKRTLNDIVKMASIVEREDRNEDQQPVVAGILWKRYDNGIGLGADATVLYALGRTKGGLTYDDLQIDSQYNTRKYRGLPPTPISNPSISSIRASIYPEKSSYLYYLHDPSGEIHYATTLEEHNLNKAKYLY